LHCWHLADEYKIETLNGDQPLIQKYQIDAKNNSLLIDFNAKRFKQPPLKANKKAPS
jgi:hypothetical protein